jgi:hypothetical protein
MPKFSPKKGSTELSTALKRLDYTLFEFWNSRAVESRREAADFAGLRRFLSNRAINISGLVSTYSGVE